jgi:sigma-B regulation protein RsbU (phosphoserine phosphatase)
MIQDNILFCIFAVMKKLTLTNRLSFMIMGILIVMSAIILSIIYVITKESMSREAESRY